MTFIRCRVGKHNEKYLFVQLLACNTYTHLVTMRRCMMSDTNTHSHEENKFAELELSETV